MGIVRDLYYARKMSAGLKLPAPTVALLIKRLRLAAAMGGGIEKTVIGTMVHITDALAKAALSVLASIEPIQDLHGYSSPWPAGGGVNILPAISETGNGFISDYRLLSDGTTAFMGTYYISQYFPVTPGKTYTYSVLNYGSETTSCAAFYDSEYNFISAITGKPNGNEAVAPSNAAYMRASNTKPNADQISYMLNEGPYSNICPITGRTGLSVYVSPTQDVADATTYAVDWTTEAGTVYGGTLEVVTGVLTVDRVSVSIDGTEGISWNTLSPTDTNYKAFCISKAAWETRFGSAPKRSATGYPLNAKANELSAQIAVYYTSINKSGIYGWPDNSAALLIVPPSGVTSNFNIWLQSNPLQICYELATPLTYQLTAQEVQMLLGENYVWSSSGDTVSVTYYAEGNANTLQSLNILLGGNYSNPKTADDVSDKEALEIILGGNK